MKDVWDRILTSEPINKTSAVVSGASGNHYEHTPAIVQWSAPPAMKPVPAIGPDLTGVRFGRFVVIGLLDAPRTKSGASWVVRCVCGMYEPRKAKSIRNPANAKDACHTCRNLEYLRTCRPGLSHVTDRLRSAR